MTSTVIAGGASHPGLRREDNQDLFHVDQARGLYMVIDGVGGQAAGGQAAEIALTMLRARLERETGPVTERLREAIVVANNEIHRVATARPEWRGMACVLTVAVVKDGWATVGHVGDTRLYKLRGGRIEKVTSDHSPVGEREDAGEISELDAMRHPRRNEVYRDVGSDPHGVGDPEFIEIDTVPFEADAALLLCSDGLSDLVPSAAIARLMDRHAGDPNGAAHALIAAANDAGGKDNVTVVCVEGERFAEHARGPDQVQAGAAVGMERRRGWWGRAARSAAWVALGVASALVLPLAVAAALQTVPDLVKWLPGPPSLGGVTTSIEQIVRPGESIAAAITRAMPGSQVLVEPGEYREQLRLREGVRVVSRVPRGATLRLPAGAGETEAAVVATGLTAGNFVGFRIVGDAATPLGTGLAVDDAALSVVDVEITGATTIAILLTGRGASLVGLDVHDNPGAGVVIRAGATPRVVNSSFARNGTPERAIAALRIEDRARPELTGNVFGGVSPEAFSALDAQARQIVVRDNWFVGVHARTPAAPAATAAPGRRAPVAPTERTAPRGPSQPSQPR